MRRVHRAWWIAGITFATLIASAAFRSTTGVLLEPIEAEFGWTRSLTSAAVSLNLLLYGLTAPFAASLMERFSLRRVVAAALALVALGSAATLVMTQSWQLVVAWGIFVGFGCGALALVFGAIVANRWFSSRRGLVTGIFSSAYATGQLIFLPAFARLATDSGWRWASACVGLLAAALIVPVLAFLRDRPSEVGLLPYGAPAPGGKAETEPGPALPSTARGTLLVLRDAARTMPFWILAGTFFVCGWSTNGLIGTHFIPAAHDHGMPVVMAASLLALVGVFDFFGTIASGWLSDKVDSVWLLFAYYGLRGLALFSAPLLLGPDVQPPLLFFIVFYGLDWVATVPPTVQLCRKYFGLSRSGVVYGWVFASHMVGAAISASYAGAIRQSQGSYTIAWITAASLCLVAALSVLALRRMVPSGSVISKRPSLSTGT
ncbi:MAG: MFS transporter [Spirochaetota bacterium]